MPTLDGRSGTSRGVGIARDLLPGRDADSTLVEAEAGREIVVDQAELGHRADDVALLDDADAVDRPVGIALDHRRPHDRRGAARSPTVRPPMPPPMTRMLSDRIRSEPIEVVGDDGRAGVALADLREIRRQLLRRGVGRDKMGDDQPLHACAGCEFADLWRGQVMVG